MIITVDVVTIHFTRQYIYRPDSIIAGIIAL